MRRMGGLKKYMPVTYWTFLIAALANAGIFPLAGFWSKDEILLGSWLEGYPWVTVVGFVAAFFTALYMARVIYLTFHGEERFDTSQLHPHESPRIMTIPLILLAIPSAVIGIGMGFPPEEGWIHDFLEPNFHSESAEDHARVAIGPAVTFAAEEAEGEEEHHVSTTQIVTFGVLSTLVAGGGWLLAWAAYARRVPALSPELWAARFGGFYRFVYRKWMFDELFETFVVHPLYVFSRFLWQIVDVRLIDATVNGVAGGVGFTSSRLRRVQTGFVANYALAIALGAVIIVGTFFLFQSDLFS